MSLTDSFVVLSGSKVGSMVAGVDYTAIAADNTVHAELSATVTDGDGGVAFDTFESWQSSYIFSPTFDTNIVTSVNIPHVTYWYAQALVSMHAAN